MKQNRAMEALRNKELRGHILRILELTHPSATSLTSIEQALLGSGAILTPDVDKHMEYLKEREYVSEKIMESNYVPIKMVLYKLTSKGVDLLEGTIQDPGVML